MKSSVNKILFIIPFILISFLLFSCFNTEFDNPTIHKPAASPYEQYGTPFDSLPAIEDIIMYEVNLRAFSENGDIQGVIDRLDHIESLGVNVIWLMPIYPVGELNSINSPYCVKDYKAVGSEYGTLEDLRDLTDEAHERNMAVILDWVANHTAWDNAWIDSASWYTQDGEGNIIHPAGTNWEDVADLNYDNQNMRAAMIDAIAYWVYEANIDGYRCDHADGVPFDFWQSAWQTLDSIPDRNFIFFAEGTRSDHFSAGFDLNFGWTFYDAVKNVINGNVANEVITAHADEYADIPEGKHWVRFTTNHDESAWDATPITLFNGIDGALAAEVITLFTGGVPLIYGSQEVGTASTVPFFYNSTIDWSANPDMLAAYQSMFQFYANSLTARCGDNAVYSSYDIFCLKKMLNDKEILIMVNTRNRNKTFNIPYALNNTYWKDHLTGEEISLSGSISFAPYQYYIFEQPSTTGIVQY